MTDIRKVKAHDLWARLPVAVIGHLLANPPTKGALATEIAKLPARDSAHAGHHPLRPPGRHDHRRSHRQNTHRLFAANGLTGTRATDFPLPLP